jgi:transposase
MDRYILTDAQWAKMEPFCLGKVTDRGRSGKDNRLFLEAVLWIARTAVHGVIYLLILVNGIPSLKIP